MNYNKKKRVFFYLIHHPEKTKPDDVYNNCDAINRTNRDNLVSF